MSVPVPSFPVDGEAPARLDKSRIATLVASILASERNAREGGLSPRDETWKDNFDLYWRRHDFSEKAEWQAQHVMPEAPGFVDRWAAALREALTSGDRFYQIRDLSDREGDLAPHFYRLMDYLVANCGRAPDGHTIDYGAVFEEQMKLGALACCCSSVVYNGDALDAHGFVQCGTVDPREVFLDHTGGARHRVRVYEVEQSDVEALRDLQDSDGTPLYTLPQDLAELRSRDPNAAAEKETASGHGQDTGSGAPIKITEFLGTLVGDDGDVIGRNVLVVLANDTHVIRGPEPNPFWHKRDWIVMTPVVVVPLSVYGKSYVEDWAGVASAFTDLTNLILDAAQAEAVRSFAMQPDALTDPDQATGGVHGGKTFLLEEGYKASDFLQAIEVGKLGRGPVTVWEQLKAEIREGAKLNEIALGQLAPTERTATEISQTSQSSSAILRSIARTIETRKVEPDLRLMLYTALQHLNFERPDVIAALGEDTARMFQTRAQEFSQRNLQVKVDGISSLIDRQTKLRNFLSMLQTIGTVELLLQEFLKETSPQRVFNHLMELFGVDMDRLRKTETEKMVASVASAPGPLAPGAGAGGPPPAPPGPGGEALG